VGYRLKTASGIKFVNDAVATLEDEVCDWFTLFDLTDKNTQVRYMWVSTRINQLVLPVPDNNIIDTEAWLGKNTVSLGERHGEIIFFMD